MSAKPADPNQVSESKTPTGIAGFDVVTAGGIPLHRTTAVYGGSGTGKTVFALQLMAHALEAGGRGVFLSFGERAPEIRESAASLGLDLATPEDDGRLVIDSARVAPADVATERTSTLEGVFVRLEQAIELVGARFVVIDALNVLSQTIDHPAAMRADLRRLLDGLKRRGVTTLITVEVAEEERFHAEGFLADCVIQLRNQVDKGIATRRLRVVKYRGADHRINEYPFVITQDGVVLTPITDEDLDQSSSSERISVGIEGLDIMLKGGVFRGDTVFVTGSAGAGKTSVTVSMAVASSQRKERCLFVAMEEPPAQITRNMKAIGHDLTNWSDEGVLRIISPKRDLEGLEAHLAFIMDEVASFRPAMLVLDPLTPLMAIGAPDDVREMIIRLLTLVKARGITVVCTLLARERYLEEQNTPFASFVDDIFLVRNVEEEDARERTLSILKARGTPHSTEVRQFAFTPEGLKVREKAVGSEEGS